MLRRGSTGVEVEQVQFWLSGLAQFDTAIPSISVDGVFGSGTEKAVKAFQKSAGLTQDGVVGQATWNALYARWVDVQSDAGGTAYPGTALRRGSKGIEVRLVQFWLRLAADKYSTIPAVTVDGNFGAGTETAVKAFQKLFGLTQDGVVGRATWAKLNEVGLAVANDLVDVGVKPGEFVRTLREGSSGTPVRALQYYLRLLSAYYDDVPSVTVDGIFGAATRRAVEAWQKHAGLTVDGIVGSKTWQSIYNAAQAIPRSGPVARNARIDPPQRTLRPGDTGPLVTTLSQTLAFLGSWMPEILPCTVTDTFTPALEATVRSAQTALDLTATGIVTAGDWAAFYQAALDFAEVNPAAPAPEPEDIWPGAVLAQGSAGPAVLQVQRWLNAVNAACCGTQTVEETGSLDAATAAALEAYQRRVGLAPLGIVDDATWNSLKAAAAASA